MLRSSLISFHLCVSSGSISKKRFSVFWKYSSDRSMLISSVIFSVDFFHLRWCPLCVSAMWKGFVLCHLILFSKHLYHSGCLPLGLSPALVLSVLYFCMRLVCGIRICEALIQLILLSKGAAFWYS